MGRRLVVVTVAQLVRALDCDSRGRGFDPRQSPQIVEPAFKIRRALFTKSVIYLVRKQEQERTYTARIPHTPNRLAKNGRCRYNTSVLRL